MLIGYPESGWTASRKSRKTPVAVAGRMSVTVTVLAFPRKNAFGSTHVSYFRLPICSSQLFLCYIEMGMLFMFLDQII